MYSTVFCIIEASVKSQAAMSLLNAARISKIVMMKKDTHTMPYDTIITHAIFQDRHSIVRLATIGCPRVEADIPIFAIAEAVLVGHGTFRRSSSLTSLIVS